MHHPRRWLAWFLLAALLAAGCARTTDSSPPPAASAPTPVVSAPVVDRKAILREASANYLLTLPPTENKLKVADLKMMFDKNPDLLFIIDTRRAEDYAKGHIAGSVNISGPKVGLEIQNETLPTDKQIVVICYTGQGAMQVTTALRMAGYNAVDLLSGYPAWEEAGYPQEGN